MSAETTSSLYVTVGVIGHIDHGKTSLVGKLTGVQTDTHPEEKRRGITIDLGFAAMSEGDYTFAFVDAPGHQKYIGNLLAGVSAVDIGLLVVACDQGIQAQTLEHLSVLHTLGIPQLVVVLSRVDLCDSQRREEMVEELQVFLSDFGFSDFPVVQFSSHTGEGLESLKQELRLAADRAQRHSSGKLALASGEVDGSAASVIPTAPFRLPIDRVLNVEGRGLVVAGTIWSGSVQVGDKLQVAGQPNEVRVRELEVHGCQVTQSHVGLRTALNLAGGDVGELKRGDELVSPGSYPQTRRLLASVELYPDAKELRLPAMVQLHLATTAVAARLLGQKLLRAKQRQVVIVETEEPIVASYEQPILFRNPYPRGSFAGGRVLARIDDWADSPVRRSNRDWVELGNQLLEQPADQQILAWTRHMGELPIHGDWWFRQLGIAASELPGIMAQALSRGEVRRLGDRLVSEQLLEKLSIFIVRLLTATAESREDAWRAEDSVVESAGHLASAEVVLHVIRSLVEKSQLVSLNGMLAIASEQTSLSKKQRARMEQFLKLYEDNPSPPALKEVCETMAITKDAALSLARHATQQRLLIDLKQGLYIATFTFQRMLTDLAERFEQQPTLSVPEIKDIWGVTRKHVIPLLEYCDQQQITIRKGDERVAGKDLLEFAGLRVEDKS